MALVAMSKHLVVAHCAAGQDLLAKLRAWEADGLEVQAVSEGDDKRFDMMLPRAAAILHVLKPIGADTFRNAPHLKLIQKIGVGVNTIDLDAARQHSVAVCNMPGTNTAAVAEMTLGLMLAALRRIPAFDRSARRPAGWQLPLGAEQRLSELGGSTVGLVGAGAVPQRLAPALGALGATVSYWSRRPRPEMEARYREWDELLACADILSLHLPLTAETEGLVNRKAFAWMKPGSILVNTARGGLVDQSALLDALDRGILRAAALDVLALEPPDENEPLLSREDVIVTPHVAWLTRETWSRSLAVARENVLRALSGRPLLFQVV